MTKCARKQRPRRTTEEISQIMRKVKSSDSKMEMCLGKTMWKKGLRYRKQYHKLTGVPDFALPSAKVAVFCDSDFWHGYRWEKNRSAFKRHKKYWLSKIEGNIARDRNVNKMLKTREWKVVRFWEHEINNNADKCAQKVLILVQKRKKFS